MDYSTIQNQFNKVISYSQGIADPQTDALFEEWYENKRFFIEKWNGLIWEWPSPVSFELSEEAKNRRVSDFCSNLEFQWQCEALAAFVDEQRDGFFANQVVKDTSYNGQKIPKGMRLSKAFKFFETNEIALASIQTEASMIMQENKIEGTLCLSVHPLDFLSTSENTHNWRSCHALDGEYRSGNLSHMRDTSTIICYLKSDKNVVLPNFPCDIPWNSKKWRTLLFFSNDKAMMFAGRQYPFRSDTGLDFVLERAIPAAGFGHWTPWLSKKITSMHEKNVYFHFRKQYIPMGSYLLPLSDVVVNETGSLQFNDLLSSSCYDPVYAMQLDECSFFDPMPMVNSRTQFRIGGAVSCCHCGQAPIQLSETFMCNDCELRYGNAEGEAFATCPCCGNRFMEEEGYWVQGSFEELICPDCAEEQTFICGCCGERVYNQDATFDRETNEWLCRWCAEDIQAKRRLQRR